jgi:hypothetical protein
MPAGAGGPGGVSAPPSTAPLGENDCGLGGNVCGGIAVGAALAGLIPKTSRQLFERKSRRSSAMTVTNYFDGSLTAAAVPN